MNSYTNQDAHNDITEQFKLFKRDKTDRSTRINFADQLVERYFSINDKIPPTNVLNRLATLILQDELADKYPDKMTKNEYPLLSDRQRDTRERDERSLYAAINVATDGLDYRTKTRDSNRHMRECFG